MPAVNAPHLSVKQDQGLDLTKFTRVCGLLGSDHEGERTNALTLGSRMLAACNMRWEDFVDSHRRAEIATEAAAVLLAENSALKAELEQLRRTGSSVALMEDVGAQVSDSRLAAEWALDLHARGQVWLAPDFEVEFLQSCTRWRGRLTPKMQSIFQRIMDRIVTRTGMTPP